MRFDNATYDRIARRVVEANPNMLVPWYLMASYAYYEKDDPFLTDDCYDWLCKTLDEKWDDIEHMHKPVVDRAALKAGTGFQLAGKFPSLVKTAADALYMAYDSPDQIAPEACRYCNGSGWFYSEEDLGPCTCPKGREREVASIDDLIGAPLIQPTQSIDDLIGVIEEVNAEIERRTGIEDLL